jgi:hypothetical protein
MSPRRAVSPYFSAPTHPSQWSYLQTGLPPQNKAFICHSLRTLPFDVGLKSFVCHSYEKCRGVGVFFPFWNAPLPLRRPHRSLPLSPSVPHFLTSFRPYSSSHLIGRSLRTGLGVSSSGFLSTFNFQRSTVNFFSQSVTRLLATVPKNSALSPIIATHPKSPSRKSFACHRSNTPQGRVLLSEFRFSSFDLRPFSRRLSIFNFPISVPFTWPATPAFPRESARHGQCPREKRIHRAGGCTRSGRG